MVLSLNINYHLQLLKIVYLRSFFLFVLFKLKMPKLFAITVNHINLTKTFVFDALEKYCSHLVVAEEKHFLNEGLHHHIYMRTLYETTVDRIKLIFDRVYHLNPQDIGYLGKLSVENCRSEKSWLIYITKQDADPKYKGVTLDQLSFYCKTLNWARNTEEFSMDDPFIISHPQYYRLLELVHARVRSKLMKSTIEPIRPLHYVYNQDQCNWHMEVIDWWNDWAINGWRHKKKQLYLYGPPNTGKTTFIRELLAKCLNPISNDNEFFYDKLLFEPMPNEPKYSLQGYDSNVHKIVFVDEFDISSYQCSDFKKLLAGESLITNTKNGGGRTITHKNPIILISNLEPPNENKSVHYRGLQERLFCVKADKLILD
jgi:hypothetical protein